MFTKSLLYRDESLTWLFRTSLAFMLCFSLFGCGYSPLPRTSLAGKINKVTVSGTPHANAFRLRLSSRITPVGGGTYRVHVKLSEKTIDLAVNRQAQAQRLSISLIAHYDVFMRGQKESIKHGITSAATGYNYRQDADIANQSAAKIAQVQNLEHLADNIAHELGIFFATRNAL